MLTKKGGKNTKAERASSPSLQPVHRNRHIQNMPKWVGVQSKATSTWYWVLLSIWVLPLLSPLGLACLLSSLVCVCLNFRAPALSFLYYVLCWMICVCAYAGFAKTGPKEVAESRAEIEDPFS